MKAAVIGTGYMGKTHIAILNDLLDSLVICSADTQTGKTLAETYHCPFYEDYLQMLDREQPDFISVCVPTHMHTDVVRAALERRIPVLCEKPFTLEASDALTLYRLAEKQQVLLMVAHCLRFSKAYAYLKDCIADQRFGSLQSLRMYRNSTRPNWSPDNWFANQTRSGGIVRDLHIHDTDMAVCLLGVPDAVYTKGNASCCTTVFSYPDNLVVVAEASWRSTPGFPFCAGYDAVFENACVTCQNDAVTLYIGSETQNPLAQATHSPVFENTDMMVNELRYFCDCVRSCQRPTLCDPRDTVKTMYVSCTQSESLQQGCFIPIRLPEVL